MDSACSSPGGAVWGGGGGGGVGGGGGGCVLAGGRVLVVVAVCAGATPHPHAARPRRRPRQPVDGRSCALIASPSTVSIIMATSVSLSGTCRYRDMEAVSSCRA